jgi:hypothetical protein
MINTEEYKAIISDLLDELPEAFFRELNGGVILFEALAIPDYARGKTCIRWASTFPTSHMW